ncbi:MAG: hypothetical protein AAFP84_20020 [Actinomycetota bacterium]
MRDRADIPTDEAIRSILRHFDVQPSGLLGHGGEAWVFALDDQHVLRVLRDTQACRHINERQALVDELAQAGAPFALPKVVRCDSLNDRSFAVEHRLPGKAVGQQLHRLGRSDRNRLVEHHLDAANALGDLHLDERGWYGDLLAPTPVRRATWRRYLTEKAADGLRRAPGFENIEPDTLAADLPDADGGQFVHLDAFTGNMLSIDTTITAVIDIGATSIRGDRRLDPLSAAVYLCAPHITPAADEHDRRTAKAWLTNAGLIDHFEPARRWLAAFWAWATDDQELHHWCREVLLH